MARVIRSRFSRRATVGYRRGRMRATLAALFAALTVAALALRPGGPAEAQSAGLTEDVLRNATYPSEYSPTRSVTLRDGRYEWSQPSPQRGTATFVRAAIGSQYAVVLLGTNTGGTGDFLSAHVVTGSFGAVQAGPGLFLGDRWRVNSLTLGGDRVLLDVVRHAPSDPLCCPTLAEVRVYMREGDALVFRGIVAATIEVAPPATGNAGIAAPERGRAWAGATLAAAALVLLARRRTATH